MKVPRYKDGAAIREAKKRCRRLYNKFKNLDFVIDDEKYFGLSEFQTGSNRSYYTGDKERTRIHVKTYSKKKFEPKVMLWIAISPKGISTPVITYGRGMAITADSYISNCLSRQLIVDTIPQHTLSSRRVYLLARKGQRSLCCGGLLRVVVYTGL